MRSLQCRLPLAYIDHYVENMLIEVEVQKKRITLRASPEPLGVPGKLGLASSRKSHVDTASPFCPSIIILPISPPRSQLHFSFREALLSSI
jgi:hypothetical protein